MALVTAQILDTAQATVRQSLLDQARRLEDPGSDLWRRENIDERIGLYHSAAKGEVSPTKCYPNFQSGVQNYQVGMSSCADHQFVGVF